jgi:putative lipoprotein
MACSEPEGILDQEAQYLALLETAASYQITDGRLSMRDEAGSEVLAFQSAVLGTVEAVQEAQLPEGAVAMVSLDDVSRADAPAVTINRVELSGMAGFPFPFAVTYNPAQIDPRMDYAISVRINDGEGSLAFINTQAYIVITKDHPSVVEVMVEEIR